jgi:hypothetical protein
MNEKNCFEMATARVHNLNREKLLSKYANYISLQSIHVQSIAIFHPENAFANIYGRCRCDEQIKFRLRWRCD